MSSLERIRGLLRDRQVKPGALGTTALAVCLDVSLVDALHEAEERLETAETDRRVARTSVDVRDVRGGQTAPEAETPEQDAEVERLTGEVTECKAAVRQASITVKFRSLGSDRYNQVVRSYDDPDGDDRQDLLDAMCSECLYEVVSDGELIDLSWEDIRPALGPGEREEANLKILSLNRRRVDVPLS